VAWQDSRYKACRRDWARDARNKYPAVRTIHLLSTDAARRAFAPNAKQKILRPARPEAWPEI
jgi:hypothetical protein